MIDKSPGPWVGEGYTIPSIIELLSHQYAPPVQSEIDTGCGRDGDGDGDEDEDGKKGRGRERGDEIAPESLGRTVNNGKYFIRFISSSENGFAPLLTRNSSRNNVRSASEISLNSSRGCLISRT